MQGSRPGNLPSCAVSAAQRLWFAGLGAAVVAGQGGARLAGSTANLFAALADRGQEVNDAALARARETPRLADEGFRKLQSLIDTQVASALERLGVPTRDDLADLSRRIERLTESIEGLRATTLV
jgi:poly(hydroxyalkanoate) granule-associated protein